MEQVCQRLRVNIKIQSTLFQKFKIGDHKTRVEGYKSSCTDHIFIKTKPISIEYSRNFRNKYNRQFSVSNHIILHQEKVKARNINNTKTILN